MSRRVGLEELLRDLELSDNTHARETFTSLFKRGCDLLDIDDKSASKLFDTTLPNVSRWRRGMVVPSAALQVLRMLRVEVDTKIHAIEPIRITFCPEANAAYVYLREIEKGGAKHTRVLDETFSVILDFDADYQLIGIEYLDPSLMPDGWLDRAVVI